MAVTGDETETGMFAIVSFISRSKKQGCFYIVVQLEY